MRSSKHKEISNLKKDIDDFSKSLNVIIKIHLITTLIELLAIWI